MNVFRSIGVIRHKLATDGDGVTTLVGGYGCPLDCKYCLNPQCRGEKHRTFSADELYEAVRADSLYFEATCGGITFGGGEPLLQIEFIIEFIKFIKERNHLWRFYIETSLAVPFIKPGLLEELAILADRFIIDVKDTDPMIYRAYTRSEPEPMLENLKHLAEICPEKLHVRLPLIPCFNTEADVERSASFLSGLGICVFDRFIYTVDIAKPKVRSD